VRKKSGMYRRANGRPSTERSDLSYRRRILSPTRPGRVRAAPEGREARPFDALLKSPYIESENMSEDIIRTLQGDNP
jgi:hypothetical protein